jgi:hypothetical protein
MKTTVTSISTKYTHYKGKCRYCKREGTFKVYYPKEGPCSHIPFVKCRCGGEFCAIHIG